MSGIEILNKTEIFETPDYAYFGFVLFLLIGLTCLVFGIMGDITSVNLYLLLYSFAFFVGSILFITKSDSIATGRYQYECTIDNSVSFEDVCEKYNVIRQNGKLYILEDKEKGEW